MENIVNKGINEEEEARSYLETCLHIVVNLTHNDEVIEDLLNDRTSLDKLSAWLTYPDGILDSSAEDLVVCACLCLGNIARSGNL
jgi:hypothetical protein